jgi:NAD-dependent dihydropyrimidine dehydrogenase PreA subunit
MTTIQKTPTNVQRCRVVLYEGHGSDAFASEERYAMLSSLLEKGHCVTLANGNGEVGSGDGSPLVIVGRFADDFASDALQATDGATVHIENVSGLATEKVIETIESVVESLGESAPKKWKPWFPVIDFDRCTNCMQCLSFCLFDVYAVDKKEQITVQNQEKCKTECPACSRVCPEVAILFPKYGKGPINGDVVRESDVQREAMKVDVSALLGGDIYASLRSRQSDARKRFSTERDESRALIERKRCLKKLQGDLDIPDEVLMSLPGVGDIQERADRAKAKMQQRLERSQTVKDQRPPPNTQDWGI